MVVFLENSKNENNSKNMKVCENENWGFYLEYRAKHSTETYCTGRAFVQILHVKES